MLQRPHASQARISKPAFSSRQLAPLPHALLASRRPTQGPQRKGRTRVPRAQQDKNDDISTGDTTESLFMRELKRRGLSPGQSGESSAESNSSETGRGAQGNDSPRFQSPSSQPFSGSKTPQLDRSRQLNSEGLEGLLPRAKELIKLGGGFFLAFVPAVIVISLLFTFMYTVFGDSFVHGGDLRTPPPQYIDPYELLGAPTVDPTVPLR